MSKKMKALVIGVILLMLVGTGVGVAFAAGSGDAQAGATNLPPELQPLVEQVKAALQALQDPVNEIKGLVKQVKQNRNTIRDLVNRIGRDNLGDLADQVRQLAQDARDDRAIAQEARQIRQDLKRSQRQVRTAVKAGDIAGARLILEQDLAQIQHSGDILQQAAQALQSRIDAQNALIQELQARAG